MMTSQISLMMMTYLMTKENKNGYSKCKDGH